MEFAKKKFKISFLGGPTTPTYSTNIKEQIMTNKLMFFFNTKQIISRDLIWF